MPNYEYKCPSCQNTETHLRKISDSFTPICQVCFIHGNTVQMIKGVGGGLAVHFKGSGFYETDYKGK